VEGRREKAGRRRSGKAEGKIQVEARRNIKGDLQGREAPSVFDLTRLRGTGGGNTSKIIHVSTNDNIRGKEPLKTPKDEVSKDRRRRRTHRQTRRKHKGAAKPREPVRSKNDIQHREGGRYTLKNKGAEERNGNGGKEGNHITVTKARRGGNRTEPGKESRPRLNSVDTRGGSKKGRNLRDEDSFLRGRTTEERNHRAAGQHSLVGLRNAKEPRRTN
jgi:hypothetical protein